ncbi:MAG: hypothetical protein QOH28_1448 [Actinomycetota bacterium]|jgi:hypothetical protein|nr:hypothetical protein [Actinomycetota bacterium]
MPSFRVGVVSEVLGARAGLQRVLVDLGSAPERAYVLTQLIGAVAVGDRVVLNTTAVELGLGTGGWHVVHWNLARDTLTVPGANADGLPGAGMKLRYTSLQVGVENAELADVADVGGMPIVAAGLHSQLAAVAVAFKHTLPSGRLVYVMTDGGALPIAISDLVWQLRERGLIDATVTCGHAFGGDFEAVSAYGALGVARHVAGADAAVVAMGPGSAGTASRLGFSGIEVGPVLDAASALHGIPIAALRVSFADARPRHRGVSHHSITALSVATRSRVRVAVPCVGGEDERTIRSDLAAARIEARHEIVDVAPLGAVGLFAAHDLQVESMGRTATEDPVLFEAAAAAGVLAARAVL